MATFNVDSLDFVDDEEIRTGADDDFATRYDSTNSRLELEDLTNATVGYVPQDVGTDLVGGKFAETVAEGKALADDGNVYDTIQEAENNASSWVKVGPGDFRENVTIETAGLTLEGSGERTTVESVNGTTINIDAEDVTVSDVRVRASDDTDEESAVGSKSGLTSTNLTISRVAIDKTGDRALLLRDGSNHIVHNCTIDVSPKRDVIGMFDSTNSIVVNCEINGNTSGNHGIIITNDDSIIANNIISNTGGEGIAFRPNDSIAIANRIDDSNGDGIQIQGTDSIVANNRVSNSGESNIQDSGTGTVLDANLTT